MKRFAVCPGSYDPVTLGHYDLVCRAAELFGSCLVVVMNNDKKRYLYSLEERTRLCRAAFQNRPEVEVTSFAGMLYEFLAQRPGAVLVKGVRNEADYLYEKEMAAFNKAHAGVETLYLDADARFQTLSSTLVREMIARNEDLSAYLPAEIIKLLPDKL